MANNFKEWRQRSEEAASASSCAMLCSTPMQTYGTIETTIPLELRASVREMFTLFMLGAAAYLWNAFALTAMWWEGNWGGVGVISLATAWGYAVFGIGASWRFSFMAFYRAARDDRGEPSLCFLLSCSLSSISLCCGAVGLTTEYGTAGALVLLSIISRAPTVVVVMLAVSTALWTAAALWSVKVLRRSCARGRGGDGSSSGGGGGGGGFAIDQQWEAREYGAAAGDAFGGSADFGFSNAGSSGSGLADAAEARGDAL